MSKDFCLLDEPWLPVRLADGRVLELGLLEVFERSGEIVGLAETAPPSLVAQYRLLLAITHRALVTAFGNWREKDRVRWYREGLPLAEIRAYLELWRERFWLFHPQYPFMQVAALASAEETRDKRKRKPWTQIALASANGNTPVVFDHAYDAEPVAIRPATAIATLLGFLQFTPGGLVKSLRDADKAGALVNTAAVIPVGQTLARTLCLALHAAPRADAEPDLPSWEREPVSIVELRGDPVLASGPNDRYTRLSRAVLLCREADGGIRWLHFAAGLALGEDPNAPDPMASFRAGSNGLVRLTFNEGRALWRDLPALVPNAGEGSQAAAVVQHAVSLHKELNPFEVMHQPLLVAGLASDQAKLLRWRMEQIALPSSLLLEPEKALHLRERVAITDELFGELKRLATGMLAQTLLDPSSKDTRARARSLVESGPLAASYFATAEQALPELLRLIGDAQPETAETLWRQVLRDAAGQAWKKLLAGLGGSARALRADALYWPRFHGLLNKKVPLPDSRVTDKEVVS
ncbi:type I-E CRISPR-associated protein Cse1/CasA [Stutzerimonas stutzeri]|uniref:Type I-E CRISPR-associated protein Cse1/CasA n=1 Tax=Stutzerimonas stutzeri TaxID=316 RepID=A0A2N8RDH3_STUST|nr:type I-E CRISPR-associated protein Cse1/CasA [Stutzerimonas stutzeri]EHY79334.1 CRISPR-associated Cse1 family protein [Stutzerimonas stutzeri ATCC 14405 = CCUG 16156]MCQ4254493.1 type I-E CRISPR-associated protein Cse1/CasA [Stutzerimonas stutzeri]PNF59140.1 type I-E CRISPR-associated protein Cse1/CasA [Stutzerimonas stutzeri]QOZ94457.1 type I-E CRISPR-associated protein Cse1/CasA [Stutzerimonas stutzeri]